jgi:hypothetical protein
MFSLEQSLFFIWSGPGLALFRLFKRRWWAKREDGFPFLASWGSGGSLGRPCISFPVEERGLDTLVGANCDRVVFVVLRPESCNK